MLAKRSILVLALSVHMAPPLFAQPVAQGPEIEVSQGARREALGRVARDATGNFLVVWHRLFLGQFSGTFGQRYDRHGFPVDGEFLVSRGLFPGAVRMNPDGDFLVVFSRHNAQDGVFARRFDSLGPLGPQFLVSSLPGAREGSSDAALHADGNFVVVWKSIGQDGSRTGVFAQRFDETASPDGPHFQVNTYTTDNQGNYGANVAMDAAGGFVIVWESRNQVFSNDVFARRFDSTGVPLGPEFLVNTDTSLSEMGSAVASDPLGRFVVAWHNRENLFLRQFERDGSPTGLARMVTSVPSTRFNNFGARVAMAPSGQFLVVWHQEERPGPGLDLFGRWFTSAGDKVAQEFPINSLAAGDQKRADISLDGAGDFVVSWESYPEHQDGSYSIVARQFLAPCVQPSPRGQGYWRHRCRMHIEGRGGQADATEPTEPLFATTLLPVVHARMAGLTGEDADVCLDGMVASPPREPCERANQQLLALLFNQAAGFLSSSCPVDPAMSSCPPVASMSWSRRYRA